MNQLVPTRPAAASVLPCLITTVGGHRALYTEGCRPWRQLGLEHDRHGLRILEGE